jgi:murein DD-endopeptidase MepM/ murein hydrolase activator NlpD
MFAISFSACSPGITSTPILVENTLESPNFFPDNLPTLQSTETIQAVNPPAIKSTLMPSIQITPFPCGDVICILPGHFIFEIPIGIGFSQQVEPSYTYGSTQNGKREPHHGVEFINAAGTPVIAAGDGIVTFAGNDSNQQFGWGVNFYGNLVIIEHEVQGYDVPIYTLYGHLSKVLVNTGDNVTTGEIIGEVGLSGKALGAHLHFEVREEINDYAHTRNPELWLNINSGNGALVGQIFNEKNEVRRYPDFQLVSLDNPGSPKIHPVPYADASLNSDDDYQEVFMVGNLPPGKYELSFSPNGKPQTVNFEIYPGKITRITYRTKY